MTNTYYSRPLKMPTTMREGLCNFVQMIINALERDNHGEALLIAVDLLNDLSVGSPYFSGSPEIDAKTAESIAANLKEAMSAAYERGFSAGRANAIEAIRKAVS